MFGIPVVAIKIVETMRIENYRTSNDDVAMSLNYNYIWMSPSVQSNLMRLTFFLLPENKMEDKMDDLRSAKERVHHQQPSPDSHNSRHGVQPGLTLLPSAFSSAIREASVIPSYVCINVL